MRRSAFRSSFVIFALFGIAPLMLGSGCKEKPAAVDAAPPPPPPPEVDAAPVDIVPMEEDAGVDAADAADAAKKFGPGGNLNVARLKQCCGQLRAEGKKLGMSPEAGLFSAAAAQCDGIAAQAGPTGTAPELGLLRTALQGRTVPGVCARF